jgi:hypothetical protein
LPDIQNDFLSQRVFYTDFVGLCVSVGVSLCSSGRKNVNICFVRVQVVSLTRKYHMMMMMMMMMVVSQFKLEISKPIKPI